MGKVCRYPECGCGSVQGVKNCEALVDAAPGEIVTMPEKAVADLLRIASTPPFNQMPAQPALPSSIRVGYRDFKLVLWPKPKNDRFGECDTVAGVLRLNPDLEGDHLVYVVLHEIFHAIHDTAGLSESSTEEQIVGAYSGFLLQVWRDNPAFRTLMNGVV